MRLLALTVVVMVAFAANSVFGRMALVNGDMDAMGYSTIRMASGGAMLALLCMLSRGSVALGGEGRVTGVLSLLLYMAAFSLSYVGIDTGIGALILFGCVQITMFAGALIGGERPPFTRWAGAAMAFGGLAWLLWPGSAVQVSIFHGLLMAASGIGWGIYSLIGRKAKDALQNTGANFILATPAILIVWLLVGVGEMTKQGVILAVLSGAITSGMGYALWYAVLPKLSATTASVAQLTVPVIATLGGWLFLSETVSWSFAMASAIVLGGVALSVVPRRRGLSRG